MTQRAKTRKKAPRAIPRFRDEDAERAFWSEHDSADYVDWTKARLATFPNLKPSTETISLRLPESLLGDLKILANRMDVPYQSLLKIYLAERVDRELRLGTPADGLVSLVREPEAPYGDAPEGTHRPRRAATRATKRRS
jgi:predicted DNA binding CopG/RHH family protein